MLMFDELALQYNVGASKAMSHSHIALNGKCGNSSTSFSPMPHEHSVQLISFGCTGKYILELL
jgi:hypothetical protein